MNSKHGVQQTKQRTDKGCGEYTHPEVTAKIDPGPTCHTAGSHNSLNAEVKDTGAFTDQLAYGAEYERGGHAYGSSPETGFKKQLYKIHVLSPPYGIFGQHHTEQYGQQ